jgi:hypothetical protein
MEFRILLEQIIGVVLKLAEGLLKRVHASQPRLVLECRATSYAEKGFVELMFSFRNTGDLSADVVAVRIVKPKGGLLSGTTPIFSLNDEDADRRVGPALTELRVDLSICPRAEALLHLHLLLPSGWRNGDVVLQIRESTVGKKIRTRWSTVKRSF